tara:strand:- start:252 stop:581 length:330 start_codon:yes stop_codon:yes gene_type:complete
VGISGKRRERRGDIGVGKRGVAYGVARAFASVYHSCREYQSTLPSKFGTQSAHGEILRGINAQQERTQSQHAARTRIEKPKYDIQSKNQNKKMLKMGPNSAVFRQNFAS